ncbi:MAG: Fe-S cluster assembly protein SufD [Candidatus Marinimicrobia bacterium]|nr:Fe-S cluster assembly protein SufD [Candidatus Neomarinimicrobiota bacterium]
MSVTTIQKPNAVIKHYRSEFQRLFGQANGPLSALRKNAFDSFSRIGFPNRKQEEWRSTNIDSVSGDFTVASPAPGLDYFDNLDFKYLPDAARIVFVNGYYSAELSDLSKLPEGVKITSLTYLLKTDPALLARHLTKNSLSRPTIFEQLNQAFFNTGAWIEIAADQPEPVTVQLIYLTRPDNDRLTFQLRNLITVGENSQLDLIEQYIGLSNETYFTNVVTDVNIGDNALLRHSKIQNEAVNGNHISATRVYQSANSLVDSLVVSLGGTLIRNNLIVKLAGFCASTRLNGLYLGRKRQEIDNHTLIDHAYPNCSSSELYKGILDNDSHAVFNGKIIVQPDAQQTDAKQINRNLLLSEKARANTNPQLEIYADDVKCAHGSTIGQLDSNALFYLRSRGITIRAAQTLMIEGFAKEVLETISDETTHALITNMVNDWFVNGNDGDNP